MQVLMRESDELETPGAARQGSCNPTMPQLTEAHHLNQVHIEHPTCGFAVEVQQRLNAIRLKVAHEQKRRLPEVHAGHQGAVVLVFE